MKVHDDSSFIHVSTSNDESTHNIGIKLDGKAYTWGKTNALGQLGRSTNISTNISTSTSTSSQGKNKKNNKNNNNKNNNKNKNNNNAPHHAPLILPDEHHNDQSIQNRQSIKAVKGYVGGTKDAGHSAILDNNGYLWLTGCDRWQQLGLGSSAAGAAGYTWKNGALWQESFQRNDFLRELMNMKTNTNSDANSDASNNINNHVRIRDVAIGGDHTVVLSENKRDVYTFGKGREGQLGLGAEKPFVSTPTYAKALSSRNTNGNKGNKGVRDSDSDNNGNIAAVCAIRHCSFTLNDNGDVIKNAGKCRQLKTNEFMIKAVQSCRDQAQKDGLIRKSISDSIGSNS